MRRFKRIEGRRGVVFLLVLMGGACLAQPLLAQCGEEWQWANPLPQGDELVSVVHDGSRFVATGVKTVLSSSSGSSWSVTGAPPSGYILGKTSYGNGYYVSIGMDWATSTYSALRSQDGAQWTVTASFPYIYLQSVGFGGGLFVAVGKTGTLYTSPDGVSWTERNSGTSQDLLAVAYGGGRFVAVGEGGAVVTSTDGSGWSPVPVSGASSDFLAVVYGGTQFVAGGQGGLLATSSSGTSWTVQTGLPPGTGDIEALAYGAGRYVATDASWAVLTSQDAVTWTAAQAPANYGFFAIAFGGGNFAAVGRGGTILTSPDGTSWTERTTALTHDYLYCAAYGVGSFVTGGSGGVFLTSPDGADWTIQYPGAYLQAKALCYGGGRFVATGSFGPILYSPDGVTWTQAASTPSPEPYALSGVAYGTVSGQGLYVAVGFNPTTIWRSQDGSTWTACAFPAGTARLNAITFGGGAFVAAGAGGTTLKSTDGQNFTAHQAATTWDFYGVAYGSGWYVAAGSNGLLFRSQDGITWIEDSSGTNMPFQSVRFVKDRFFAAGGFGTMLTSASGGAWSAIDASVASDFWDVAYSGSTVVAVGSLGAILHSPCGGGSLVTVTSVTPSTGPSSGWTPVTITGSGFASPAVVRFGTLEATEVAVVSSTTLTCLTPPHLAGAVDVLVIVEGVGDGFLPGGYTYTGGPTPPSITGVTKAGNPFRIKIAGSNFQSGAAVTIGSDGNPWGQTARKSDSLIVLKGGSALKAKFPQGQPVQIRVRNPDGGEATYIYTRP
jgi:hypothetical protein